MAESKMQVGAPVVVVDSLGKRHNGILTNVFGWGTPEEHFAQYKSWPCANVVFVSDDEKKTDPYGRQLERFTSFPHKSSMPGVNGMYFLFPEEAQAQ